MLAEVRSNRVLVRPSDLDRSCRFYRDVLGLAIFRKLGPPADPGLVLFLGLGLPEVSGHASGPVGHPVMTWTQVRDVHDGHAPLAAVVFIIHGPTARPWGLTEMWDQDPDGIQVVLAKVPADHHLRRDVRSRRHQDDELYAAEARVQTQRWRCINIRLAARRLGRGRDGQWCGEPLITVRRPADMALSERLVN